MSGSWLIGPYGRIEFGRGTASGAGDAALQFGRRCLVCTDRPMVEAGVVAPVVDSIREAGGEVEVFDGGEPEVPVAVVSRCAERARGFRPDVLVAVGGGSSIDLAKAASAVIAHGGRPSDYYGEFAVPGPGVPIVAIPTTAGTGSEVTPVAVVGDDEIYLKVGIASRHLVPSWAILDPELTVSCPASVTAHAGLDALSHAIEAFTAAPFAELSGAPASRRVFTGKNPVSDALARESIRLVGANLRRCHREPGDIDAREGMLGASLFAGLAFGAAGTALIHAMQYPLGALTKRPHGLVNAILMPAVIEFNLEAREPEYETVASLLAGEPTAADRLPELVRELNRDLGIPDGLAAIGVEEGDVARMAELTMGVERLLRLNPRKVTDPGQIESVLRRAM